MSDVFGPEYANVYDALYQDKDYAIECDLLECIFREYGKEPIKTILDLGCGTGNHTLLLAERGFEVTGIDCSQEMLDAAQIKAQSKSLPSKFYLGDIRQVNLGKKFDVVLMMFAVLGYQVENSDVLAALKAARHHLNPGDLLILDVWYGPAVLAQRPTDRIKVTSISDSKILRAASGDLDIRHHVCTVQYHLWQLNGDILRSETQEEHSMRFFFPQELELFMQVSGFKLKRLGAFPDYKCDPGENTWNAIAICMAE